MPFPTVVDDDGTGTTGTVLDKAFFDAYNAEIAARDTPGGSSYSFFNNTGTVDLALPPARQIRTMIFTGSADCTIRSMAGAAVAGDIVILKNYGTGTPVVYLKHNNTAPALINMVVSADTPIAVGGSATYVNTGANAWLLIGHEQGAWITPPYSAANFTGSGAMTWTVDAGDVTTLRWVLRGRTMHMTFRLDSTAVGGTVNNQLTINNPAFGGFTVANIHGSSYALNDGGAWAVGQMNALTTVIQLFKLILGTNWTVGAVAVYGQITFEVN